MILLTFNAHRRCQPVLFVLKQNLLRRRCFTVTPACSIASGIWIWEVARWCSRVRGWIHLYRAWLADLSEFFPLTPIHCLLTATKGLCMFWLYRDLLFYVDGVLWVKVQRRLSWWVLVMRILVVSGAFGETLLSGFFCENRLLFRQVGQTWRRLQRGVSFSFFFGYCVAVTCHKIFVR